MYANFETDVISILAKLSVFMQHEKCMVSDIMLKVHTTVEVLCKCKTQYVWAIEVDYDNITTICECFYFE